MTFNSLPEPLHMALFFSIFFLGATLLTGIWKWRAMLGSSDGQAHKYVDIAHHAALHYGPFIILTGALASFWPWGEFLPAWVLVAIMGATMMASLSRYISLGIRGTISNQLHKPTVPARLGLVFFFVGSALPGLTIAIGATVGLWANLPGRPF